MRLRAANPSSTRACGNRSSLGVLLGTPSATPESDKVISASVQWARNMMEKIDRSLSDTPQLVPLRPSRRSGAPGTISCMTNLNSVLNQLEQERGRLRSQLDNVSSALSALNVNGSFRRGRMSAGGRARIAAAQRARWAKVKGQKVVSIASRKGHTMSPAARRRIAAAQKARWAKWRKTQKSA